MAKIVLLDTTNKDYLILQTEPKITVNGNSSSIINLLVSGVNSDWALTQTEFLVLQEEIKANISPYCSAFTIIPDGPTFTVTGNDVTFFDQLLSNNWVTGGSI